MDPTLLLAMPKKFRPASEFGERLTALRKARGPTQVQLADRIGSTQRAVSSYETIADRAEARRLWKKFQQVMALPEKDRRAVIRLVNSLVTAKSPPMDRNTRRRRAAG